MKNRRLRHPVTVRLLNEEKTHLEQAAAARGTSLQRYLRDVLAAHVPDWPAPPVVEPAAGPAVEGRAGGAHGR